MSEEVPQFVSDKISAIQQRTGVDRQEIISDFLQIFQDPFVRDDNQFSTDESRYRYSLMVLWNNYINRPPAKLTKIIVVALGSIRRTRRTGKLQGEVMTLCKDANGTHLRRLVLQEPALHYRQELVEFAGYSVKLGEFSSGGDLVADNRAVFENPVRTGLTPERVLKIIGAVRIPTLLEMAKPEYLSKVIKTATGTYVDVTDWKVVRGLVDRSYRGPRKKDPEIDMGVYNVVDLSLARNESNDGQNRSPAITVWCAPEYVKWADDSELEFAGPVSVDNDGVPSMNAYMITPIHARRSSE